MVPFIKRATTVKLRGNAADIEGASWIVKSADVGIRIDAQCVGVGPVGDLDVEGTRTLPHGGVDNGYIFQGDELSLQGFVDRGDDD